MDRSSKEYKEKAAAYRRRRYREDPEFRERVHRHTRRWLEANPRLPRVHVVLSDDEQAAILAKEHVARITGRRRKSDELGMDFGTATHRLRRIAMWGLLVKTQQTQCFRCGRAMDVDSWSIDHVVDWQGVSPDIFWDPTNLSYSHKTCNSRATRRNQTKIDDSAPPVP